MERSGYSAGAQAWMGVWEGVAEARSAHRRPLPQGSLLRGQLPPFLKGFFQSSEPVVVVRIMGTASEALHRLGAHITETLGLRVAINTRAFFDDVSAPRRGGHPISCPSGASPGPSSKAAVALGQGGGGAGQLPGCVACVAPVGRPGAAVGTCPAPSAERHTFSLSPTCPHPPDSSAPVDDRLSFRGRQRDKPALPSQHP